MNDNKIVAQIYDSINFDVGLGRFEWLNIDTDGNVQRIEYDMGSDKILSDTPKLKEGITWFAELRTYINITNEDTTGIHLKILTIVHVNN